jgi:hypothetical protein
VNLRSDPPDAFHSLFGIIGLCANLAYYTDLFAGDLVDEFDYALHVMEML